MVSIVPCSSGMPGALPSDSAPRDCIFCAPSFEAIRVDDRLRHDSIIACGASGTPSRTMVPRGGDALRARSFTQGGTMPKADRLSPGAVAMLKEPHVANFVTLMP